MLYTPLLQAMCIHSLADAPSKCIATCVSGWSHHPPPLLQCKKKLNVYFSFITIKIYKPFIICQKKTIDKILSDKSIKIQYSFISNHNWLYIFEWRRPQSFKKKDDLLDEVQYNRTTAPPAVRL